MFYLEYNIRLFFFLLFQEFDIACGVDLDTILPCYLVSKIKRKKSVYDAHELFPEVPEVINRPFTKKIWLAIEKFSVKRIKNKYTVSAGLAEYFENRYKEKFEVIRNLPIISEPQQNPSVTFSRDPFIKPGTTDEEPFILYQGALNEGRGLEPLIEAMQQIPLKLKIAGEGDLSDSLRSLVHQKKLEHKVEFPGRKNRAELSDLTRQSFIGLNLLENRGLSYYYSLANKFFDYVVAGVPGITMNFPEYQKLNKEFEVALLIDDLQPDTIADAILKLSVDKDYYFRLRKNCLQARLQWNWQKDEQKLLAFYDRLQ
jgi:glycosyltransferase involved in cell wall biosynthesis